MSKEFTKVKAIETLLKDYFQAVYKADVTTLKTIFHTNASMYGYLGDNAVVGTPEIFFADLLSKPSMEASAIECNCVIDSIQVEGSVATATIYVDNFYGVANVKDAFHLLEEAGQWHIVCKTFTTL